MNIMLRVSIASLLGVVTFCAFGFAALRNSSNFVSTTMFTVVLGAIVLATLTALASKQEHRWFWLGFAISAAVYFGFIFDETPSENFDYLLTGYVNRFLKVTLLTEAELDDWRTEVYFDGIAHLFWTLIVGFVGGGFTYWIRKRYGK
jgi:hypothetical protein